MEVPGLGAESELKLLAYTTGTARPDLSCICNLYHSSRQRWILNPLREARDQICVLMDTSQIHFHWATRGSPPAETNFLTTDFFFFFSGCTHSMWKFLSQGSNSCHSFDPGCCSDNARSLTCCAKTELPTISFFKWKNVDLEKCLVKCGTTKGKCLILNTGYWPHPGLMSCLLTYLHLVSYITDWDTNTFIGCNILAVNHSEHLFSR